MATPTYTPIASITLGSSASSVEFSSIPQDYRDLVLVLNTENAGGYRLRFNGDDTNVYADVTMKTDGTVKSESSSSQSQMYPSTVSGGGRLALIVANIMDYSATDKHKTVLFRAGQEAANTEAIAARWADTSAITSLEVFSSGSFATGGTFSLYGIEA